MPRNILVGLPAYRGCIEMDTLHLILKLRDYCTAKNWGITIEDRINCGVIHSVRNYFVAKALAGRFTDLIMIDDDVALDPEELPGGFIRWLEAPVDFVAGVYPTRSPEREFRVRYLPDPGGKGLWADKNTGLLEVEAVPAGFIRMSRECLSKMVYFYDGLKVRDHNAPGGYQWCLFYHEIKDMVDYSEDLNFCLRWRAIGGKVWIDPDMKMRHIGRNVFRGCIGEWLRGEDPREDELEAA